MEELRVKRNKPKTYYYHYDRLGSVRFMSDESGNVVSEYVYDGWGNLVSSSGSVSQPYEFVGREGYYREGELGLYLLGQRWYDSNVGRFISRELFLLYGHPYIYCENNPVNYIDPYGLLTKKQCLKLLEEWWRGRVEECERRVKGGWTLQCMEECLGFDTMGGHIGDPEWYSIDGMLVKKGGYYEFYNKVLNFCNSLGPCE